MTNTKGIVIIGSHNSLSYLKPKHWYQWIFYPWARCQSKTLKEQYDSGVRYFDIRVRFDKNNNVVFCHNNTIFNLDRDTFCSMLNNLPIDCYFRFMLDYRSKPKYSNAYKTYFKHFIDSLGCRVNIHQAIIYWEGENIYCNIPDKINLVSCYASESGTIFKYLPPIFYKWFGKRKYTLAEGFTCYLEDFV
ncbi:MAG: hypothetical protein ACI398_04050 [Clostridium sp.]